MNRIKSFITNYKFSVPLAIIIIAGVFFFASQGNSEVKSEFVTVKKGVVSQEVSVTGRVRPAEEVALSAQTGGKVQIINAEVGQQVVAGQTLLKVDDADLQIRLGRQQATLAKARLALAKQEPGAGNASSDLKKAYEDGFNTISDAFLDLPSIITGLDNIINDWRHSPYLDQERLRPLGQTAMDSKLEVIRTFTRAEDRFEVLTTKFKSMTREASAAELEAMLNDTYEATKLISDSVKSTRNLVDYVESKVNDGSAPEINTDQEALSRYTQETNSHLSALLAIKNTIKNSRDQIVNETNDTQSSRIDIRQAELDIQDMLVQIGNRTIKAPTNGLVTKVSAEVGETISPGTPIISIISANQFEIEANVPEADIAKLALGAETDVTLDAYGSDVHFKARVLTVDPAETLVDGVATYKAIFQFVDKDDRIKSGMTASLIVKGERKENVIAIPQRAVITKNGSKYVQVVVGEETVEKEVQTGMRGSDGNIEITSGLIEGDKVVVFTEK